MATKEQLNAAIDGMTTVCAKGKEEMRRLMEVVTGVRLTESVCMVPKAGQVYEWSHSEFRILSYSSNGRPCSLSLDGKIQAGDNVLYRNFEDLIRECGYRFVANSLQEALDKGLLK